MEGHAGNEGDVTFHRHQQLSCIDAFRQGHPEEEAALGACPPGLGREVPFQHLQHQIAPLAVHAADLAHVLVKEAVVHHLVGHHLVEGARVQVHALLGHDAALDDRLRCDDPAKPQAGSQRLGKGAQIDDVAVAEVAVAIPVAVVAVVQPLGVEHEQRREMVALKP